MDLQFKTASSIYVCVLNLNNVLKTIRLNPKLAAELPSSLSLTFLLFVDVSCVHLSSTSLFFRFIRQYFLIVRNQNLFRILFYFIYFLLLDIPQPKFINVL